MLGAISGTQWMNQFNRKPAFLPSGNWFGILPGLMGGLDCTPNAKRADSLRSQTILPDDLNLSRVRSHPLVVVQHLFSIFFQIKKQTSSLSIWNSVSMRGARIRDDHA